MYDFSEVQMSDEYVYSDPQDFEDRLLRMERMFIRWGSHSVKLRTISELRKKSNNIYTQRIQRTADYMQRGLSDYDNAEADF